MIVADVVQNFGVGAVGPKNTRQELYGLEENIFTNTLLMSFEIKNTILSRSFQL